MNLVGLVVIGRNEGDRLRRCLLSAQGNVAIAVYVDSGSTDGSVDLARSLSADVVELDLSAPFTALRVLGMQGLHIYYKYLPKLNLSNLLTATASYYQDGSIAPIKNS